MMKIISAVLLVFSLNSIAQFSIESNFNVVHIGRNQSLMLKYNWNRLSISAGVKYSFNKLSTFPQSYAFKKAFWAIDFIEHWGIATVFQWKLLDRENIDLFAFYDFQFSKSHVRLDHYYAIAPLVSEPQSEYDYAYEKHLAFVGPVLAAENNFGLGINVYFSDCLYFTQKIGGGILFRKNLDKQNIFVGAGFWELSEMVSFGLGWKFLKK